MTQVSPFCSFVCTYTCDTGLQAGGPPGWRADALQNLRTAPAVSAFASASAKLSWNDVAPLLHRSNVLRCATCLHTSTSRLCCVLFCMMRVHAASKQMITSPCCGVCDFWGVGTYVVVCTIPACDALFLRRFCIICSIFLSGSCCRLGSWNIS